MFAFVCYFERTSGLDLWGAGCSGTVYNVQTCVWQLFIIKFEGHVNCGEFSERNNKIGRALGDGLEIWEKPIWGCWQVCCWQGEGDRLSESSQFNKRSGPEQNRTFTTSVPELGRIWSRPVAVRVFSDQQAKRRQCPFSHQHTHTHTSML